MKQFITICTLALLTLAGTQNTQAQTKEETLEWLKLNGERLSYWSWVYKEGDFRMRYVQKLSDFETLGFSYNNNNMSGGVSRNIKVLYTDILYEDVETLEKRKEVDDYSTFLILLNPNNKIDKNEKYLMFMCEPDKEENAKRVIKAIMHMAKLSGAKENKQHF